jgi:PRC-barrel domain protein
MLHTYSYEQLRELGGHEVIAEDGEKIGYVDLIFRDDETGEPEWLGIWDGLPDSKPRRLVPVRDVRVEGDTVRLPWSAEVVHNAPSYEAPHNVTIGHDSVVEIDAETERTGYDHYGIEPPSVRPADARVVHFRIWRIQSF